MSKREINREREREIERQESLKFRDKHERKKEKKSELKRQIETTRDKYGFICRNLIVIEKDAEMEVVRQ